METAVEHRDRISALWWRLKGLEAAWVIAPLQRLLEFDRIQPVIKLSKVCTRKGAYAAYAAALLGACPRSRYAELLVAFVLSRRLNEWLKRCVSQQRPYCEFPETVVYFKKRKKSHSFPSQSVQTLCIGWCAFVDENQIVAPFLAKIGAWYMAALIVLVAVVRIYRGLHYPHDVLASACIARTLVTAVAGLLHRLAFPKHMAALLVGCFSAQDSLSPEPDH